MPVARAAVAALTFLTRVPLGRLVKTSAADVARGAPFFPVVGALVGVCLVAADLPSLDGGAARGLLAAEGTIVVDGPTVFLWGIILVFAIGGVLLFAERRLEGGVSAFAGQAAALPGWIP